MEAKIVDKGVIINGVKWATRNVDKPGTFAANPKDAGMMYQLNRKTGWSATDPMINSNGGTGWDHTMPKGTEWEKANDPSPEGWRVPTMKEQEALLDTNKVNQEWTTENGINGTRFTDKITDNSIFMPAAGYRNTGYRQDANGKLIDAGSCGYYWSRDKIDDSLAWSLHACKTKAKWGSDNSYSGFSVRPVGE